MKTPRDVREEISSAKQRVKTWDAIKHKYPVNTEWWRDFYLSPGHAENAAETQELIQKAVNELATEELNAEQEAAERAARAEMVNKSPEARASRRADGLRILFFNLGSVSVVFLLLYFALRLAGRDGLPSLEVLWVLALFIAPFCYVMAFVYAFRATSLWEKARSRQNDAYARRTGR